MMSASIGQLIPMLKFIIDLYAFVLDGHACPNCIDAIASQFYCTIYVKEALSISHIMHGFKMQQIDRNMNFGAFRSAVLYNWRILSLNSCNLCKTIGHFVLNLYDIF